jgi:outer membrane receptor for ferrienterochelin and colicin
MQMASNSTAGTPIDLWFTASPNVEPQLSDMASVGLFRNFFDQKLETSVEVYYKEMKNVIDFKDHASLYGNPQLEAELRFGRAKSYGSEFSIQFPSTRLNGWISYTYSHTIRKIDNVNRGKEYLAPYDKPHTVNVVLSYDMNENISLGATWVYSTGAPITLSVEGSTEALFFLFIPIVIPSELKIIIG